MTDSLPQQSTPAKDSNDLDTQNPPKDSQHLDTQIPQLSPPKESQTLDNQNPKESENLDTQNDKNPQSPPKQSQDLDPQNPKNTSDFQNPSQKIQSLAPEIQNPPAQNPIGSPNQQEEPQIVVEDQEQEHPEQQEQENPEVETEEGMNLSLSPPQNPSNSDTQMALETKGNPPVSSVRRAPKRKKGFAQNPKSLAALEKKLQALSQKFNPIPFVPVKALDFDKYEGFLKELGLWDFVHIEFDKNLRADLIGQLIVNYATKQGKQRVAYVNGCRIGVNRADLGRALNLSVKKPVGDSEEGKFPAEFLSFLDEFVSNWVLLHGDFWRVPDEVMNFVSLIKKGHPDRLDWAGLIWYMVEKELAQGLKLEDCYYASHLQQLIKVQREDLFWESEKVELTIEDDDDSGDVRMLDSEEASLVSQKSEEQNVELRVGEDHVVAKGGNVGDVDEVGNVGDGDEVQKVGDGGEVKKVGDGDEVRKVGDGDEVQKVGDGGEVHKVGDADEVQMVDDVDQVQKIGDAEMVENVEDVDKVEDVDDDHKVGNADEDNKVDNVDSNEHVENIDNANELVGKAHECIENVENLANAKEDNRDVDLIDFEYCRGDEQGQWLLHGRNDGGQPFLQRCSMADVKVSVEDNRRHDIVGEDIEDEEVEDDGHVEGFKIMQKEALDGMSSANLMQAFGTGQLPYTSTDLNGQSSLNLMSSRPENNMMLGGPSMFNHAGKREIVHEQDISHHALNDNHKKMRMDDSWDYKKMGMDDFDLCTDNMVQWLQKAKLIHDTAKQEVYQANITQQFKDHQIELKDAEIQQLKCELVELQRTIQTEVHRRDRELYLMKSVIEGYRKALHETQRVFAEYRKSCAVRDEPIYKDAGKGGVVKSIMELEKEHIKQEEEKKMMCCILEDTYKNQLDEYDLKWKELLAQVESLGCRLVHVAKEVELVKEHCVKRKTPETAQIES